MKMKMKTKNGKRAARDLAEEIPTLDDLMDEEGYDRVAEKMLRAGAGLIIPVTIDDRSRLDFCFDIFNFSLKSYNPDLLNQFINILGGQDRNNIPATLELNENDKDLKNLRGFITIPNRLNIYNIVFSIEDEESIDGIKDKVMNAYYAAQNRGSINVRIYPRNLASTPTSYTLAVNEGDAQTESEELADEELRKIRALLESEDVEIKKEKAMPAIELASYVMDGVNVDVDPSANGDMVVRVKRPNGIIQGLLNGAAGFANGIMNGVERLSRDIIILDADARKSYQQNYKVDNNKIKEMNFKEMRKQLMELSESIDETPDLIRGVGRMGKRGGNKKNVNNYDDITSVIVTSIECEDGIKIEGIVRTLRASSNKNEIVMVVKPLKRLEAGAYADIRRRNRMRRKTGSRVTIMRGLVEA